ncbi:rhamnogalacturonan acetylesterase [Kiritimatiellaeota bacterium B1221]|nr:rhamnogalacturonan acetylesterase [Kiritimatiellaeota bacterium B1221]
MIKVLCLLSVLSCACTVFGEAPVTVVLIGDSTVTEREGWGKAFAGRFDDQVTVVNHARGGRSSMSWHQEGLLPRALADQPDYALIQFGHNDQPGKGPKLETDPQTTYKEYLTIYIEAFRKAGAQPVLVTPVARRWFNKEGKVYNGKLAPFAQAARELGEELDVPVIDLNTSSVALQNEIGEEATMKFNRNGTDKTHFNETGAEVMTDLILRDLKTGLPELYERVEKPESGPDSAGDDVVHPQ